MGAARAGSLHAAAVVAKDFALLTEVLRVLLALVRHVQAIGLFQGPLQRGRKERVQRMWKGSMGKTETDRSRKWETEAQRHRDRVRDQRDTQQETEKQS